MAARRVRQSARTRRCSSRRCARTRPQAAERMPFGTPDRTALAPERIEEERRHVERQMLGQVQPEQRRRHVLDEGPDAVALAVIHGEVTAVSAQRRADMPHDGRGHVETAVTVQAEAEAQVDVLEVTEVRLVEPANLVEGRPQIQRRRGARRKHFGTRRPASSRPPRCDHCARRVPRRGSCRPHRRDDRAWSRASSGSRTRRTREIARRRRRARPASRAPETHRDSGAPARRRRPRLVRQCCWPWRSRRSLQAG